MKNLATFVFASAFVLLAGRTAFASKYTKLPSDRILLMNNDTRRQGPVSGQGYYDTYENNIANGGTNETYWVHDLEGDLPISGVNTNLLPGITHTLFHTNGTTLWRLEHCRAGSGTVLDNKRYNYIPWNKTYAMSILPPYGKCSKTFAAGVGSVNMGNTTNAVVYSPYYNSGIGVVYFDSVNRNVANVSTKIGVQIATNAVGSADFASTNYNEYAWFDCPFDVLDVFAVERSALVSVTNVYVHTLNATESEGNHFFRYRVRVNEFLDGYHGPIRFRIRRLNAVSGSEMSSFVTLDNILVSYPAMGAVMYFDGAFDDSKTGADVVGRQNMFNLPFLYDGCPETWPSAYFEPVTNNSFATTSKDFEMTNVVFNWRWTYLNQTFVPADGSWNQIKMEMDENCNTQLVACTGEKGVVCTNGVGDIEFYMTAEADIPYYDPVDYTGAKMFGEGWSEAATNITLRSEGVVPQTGGHEFFSRIRPGYSPWEDFVMETVTTFENGKSVTNDVSLELFAEHKWRGYWSMPTNYVGGVTRYRFRGVNWQNPAETNRMPSINETIYGCTTTNSLGFPFSGAGVEDGKLWGTFVPDTKSTHLLIELNDETMTFGVSHADYQNFNLWTDVASRGYMGHSTNVYDKVGVSPEKQAYPADLSSWGASSNSNEAVWDEHFTLNTYGGDDFPMDVEFAQHATPNGWTAYNGMFVKEKLEEKPSGMALQMQGEGKGFMQMSGLRESSQPNGIDTVTFRAHVAQTMGFDDFSYGYNRMSDAIYAVSAQLMMSIDGEAGMTPNTPSISLVANYRPKGGGYEFRMTRLTSSKLRCELRKWYKVSRAGYSTMTNVVLQTKDFSTGSQLVCSSTDGSRYSNWTSAYLSVYPYSYNTKCRVTAKLANARNGNSVGGDTALSGSTFSLDFDDDGSAYGAALYKGSFGVGAAGCAAVFGEIRKHGMQNETTPRLSLGEDIQGEINSDDWAVDGRIGELDDVIAKVHWVFGLQSRTPENEVIVYVNEAGEKASSWREIGRQVVSGFGFADGSVEAHSKSNCLVQISAGGEGADVRTDVVIDDVHITSWAGEDRPTRTSANYGLYREWVSTSGWTYEQIGGGKTNVCCTFQPSRGRPDYPMGMRSPLITSGGLSYLVFSYTNANRYASVLVQVATNITDASQVNNATESLDTNTVWTTIDRHDFNLGEAYSDGGAGTRTSYFSLRAPVTGLVRLILDPKVVSESEKDERTDYGSITITDVKVHDEPALDDRCWWGWNVWTTGWKNGFPLTRGYLNDSPSGLSGSLNFSASASENKTGAVAEWTGVDTGSDLGEPDKADTKNNEYAANDPFIQGPSLYTGIGKVSFRARKFDVSDKTPAVVSLYVSEHPERDEWNSKPVTNFYVTASTYQLFTWETLVENSGYKAMRLMVHGAKNGRSGSEVIEAPAQRVMLDEIVISESITPRVAFANVRPFRTHLDELMIITNVVSADNQPLVGESWGIQADVAPRQMGDDIQLNSIRVFMSYHVGKQPWGISNWTNGNDRVELSRVGTNLTWRSSYDRPSSIVPPNDVGGTVVQYALWAEFLDREQKAGDAPHVHQIADDEWTMPEWYVPSATMDYNSVYASQGWSPFTILDTISPYRAWINEINIFDHVTPGSSVSPSKTNQYVELAVPAGADLTGWKLNLVAGSSTQKRVNLWTFGVGDSFVKKITPSTNNYVFVSAQSPTRASNGGEADVTWLKVTDTAAYLRDGAFDSSCPAALELVRKSGIVEHRVVVEGSGSPSTWRYYSGTNLCSTLLASGEESWMYVGKDSDPCSLGVFKSHGEYGIYPNDPALTCWSNMTTQTAGTVNENQDVPEGWYLAPGGTNVWIYAFVDGDHVIQWAGVETNKAILIIMPLGSSTNLNYKIEPWYEIASMTTNSAPVADAIHKEFDYVLELKDVMETVTVNVNDAVANRLVDRYGLTAANPYTPAVLAWLQETAPNGGEIYPAKYYNLADLDTGFEFSLTDMYWLNIPATEDGWRFKAGLTDRSGKSSIAAEPVPHTNVVGGVKTVITNVRVNVFMQMTNSISGDCFRPTMLRGLAPGETSYSYGASSPAWTSVTFKVTAALQNGRVDDVYQPLRWFVFGPDSFGAPGTPEEYVAHVEITDPFSTGSPTYPKGWSAWRGTTLFWSFAIDNKLEYNTVEMLNTNSLYEATSGK